MVGHDDVFGQFDAREAVGEREPYLLGDGSRVI